MNTTRPVAAARQAATVRPTTYAALEAEVYASLETENDRATLVAPPSVDLLTETMFSDES